MRTIESNPDICGFPGQMLGGYLAGLVAVGDASEVTLRRPVAGGSVLAVDGTEVRCDSEMVATVSVDPARRRPDCGSTSAFRLDTRWSARAGNPPT